MIADEERVVRRERALVEDVEWRFELRRAGANARMKPFLDSLEDAYAGLEGKGLAEVEYLMGRMYRALNDDARFIDDVPLERLVGALAPARVVDGKLLWWYGPRIPDALRELRTLFAWAATPL